MSTDEARVIALSVMAAKRYCWGRRLDWMEFLGSAWKGVSRMPADADQKLSLLAGKRVIQSDARQERGRGPKRAFRDATASLALLPLAVADSALAADADPRPPENRVMAAWSEGMPRRAGMTMLRRVMLYLYAVEGLKQQEIADLFGVTQTAVYYQLRDCLAGIDRTTKNRFNPNTAKGVETWRR